MWIAGLARAGQAPGPPAHAVQSRSALGHDRHGFHEPEPGGPRRPRVRLSSAADAEAAEGDRRPLAGRRRCRSGWRRGCGPPPACDELRRLKVARLGDNMRQVAVTEGDKVEAQIRLGVEVNGYGIGELVPHVAGRRRDGRGPARGRSTTRSTRVAAAAAPRAGRAARRSATRPGSSWACGRSWKRRLRGLHRHLRGPRRPGAAARPGRPAAHGRRLRLRRRGRLEDGRPGAGDEGDGRRTARRHVVHGGLYLSPGPRRPAGLRRPHAGDLPLAGRRQAVVRDPSAGDRRQERSGAAGVHRAGRARP